MYNLIYFIEIFNSKSLDKFINFDVKDCKLSKGFNSRMSSVEGERANHYTIILRSQAR